MIQISLRSSQDVNLQITTDPCCWDLFLFSFIGQKGQLIDQLIVASLQLKFSTAGVYVSLSVAKCLFLHVLIAHLSNDLSAAASVVEDDRGLLNYRILHTPVILIAS